MQCVMMSIQQVLSKIWMRAQRLKRVKRQKKGELSTVSNVQQSLKYVQRTGLLSFCSAITSLLRKAHAPH